MCPERCSRCGMISDSWFEWSCGAYVQKLCDNCDDALREFMGDNNYAAMKAREEG